jgi:predicted transcriptional regulator
MSTRRSRLDIMLNILSAVKEGVDKPTRIMYAANLSWNSAMKILSSLVDQELIREIEILEGRRLRKRYEITEKGVITIAYFDKARDLIDIGAITS